jgi:pimeloyl-ACP methyl ester carboxylesterase
VGPVREHGDAIQNLGFVDTRRIERATRLRPGPCEDCRGRLRPHQFRKDIGIEDDYGSNRGGIPAPVLLIHGRYDRMVAFEVSIAILNHIADSRLVLLNNRGRRPPFEKPAEWTTQILAFLWSY